MAVGLILNFFYLSMRIVIVSETLRDECSYVTNNLCYTCFILSFVVLYFMKLVGTIFPLNTVIPVWNRDYIQPLNELQEASCFNNADSLQSVRNKLLPKTCVILLLTSIFTSECILSTPTSFLKIQFVIG